MLIKATNTPLAANHASPWIEEDPDLEPWLLVELVELKHRILTMSFATKVWQAELTAEQRDLIGGDLPAAWNRFHGTLGILSYIWQCDTLQSLVRVGNDFGLLRPRSIEILANKLQIDALLAQRPTSHPCPIWRRDVGKLYFQGAIIRTVNSPTKARNIAAILDAFQCAGWPPRIPSPITIADAQRIREAVYSLRRGLTGIDFEADKGGIRWKVRTAAQLPR